MIDVLLKEQGWDVKDRSHVITEVDTKQSDFKNQSYKRVSDTLYNDMDSKYVDYLLLDSYYNPIAIIEAKRTSKDPIATAQKQAEEYADDIKAQIGRDVFIFMSNGYMTYFWDRERYGPRAIHSYFSQRNLERMRFQVDKRKELSEIEIDTTIVDRSKSIENVKRILEHLDKGNRKALIVMATGTGKTRVAMAIIDCLMKANWAQKMLFLADRKALRDQAYNDGFKVFFEEEPKSKILSGVFDKGKSLYVSTIQTFMECYNQKNDKGEYLISPGDFDLIISDESHRSIYNKWKEVFTYLDAIQIGLTATPADMIERNTFRFFNCEHDMPTAMYDYEEAVKDGILCDFRKHILRARTYFQLKGVTKKDLSNEMIEELVAKGVDVEEIDFEGTELEKNVVVTGTNEAIVREFMENCLMDSSGTLPAKTIFFAISKKHAKRIWEAFERLYPEYKGRLVRIILSDDPRAQESISDFKKNSFPRVAISVDMLDTGIDVPEVCNLVFAKPVFSKIKFWQMLGRGTRSDKVCKHKEWLPDGKKEYFKVFDFWNNFEFFEMNPTGDQREFSEAVTTRIFLVRLNQLERCKDPTIREFIKQKVLGDVKSLPKDSVMVRENIRDVEKALSPKLWDTVGVDPLEFLRAKMAPLMRFKEDVNLNISSFVLKAERLALSLIEKNEKEKQRYAEEISGMLDCLPTTIDAVRKKKELLDKATSKKFWREVTFDDCQMMLNEFSDLMRYKTDEPRNPIILDMDDMIKERKLIQFGPDKEEYIQVYKEKVESRVKELVQKHPTMKKITSDEVITEKDLAELEKTLNSPELFITEDVLKKVYDQNKGTLVQFVKKILGLYKFPDPEEKVKESFETYIIEFNKQYDANQLNFIRTVQSVFVQKKHIAFDELFGSPFTNFGTNAPMPMFTEEELKEFIEICNRLEKELFAHA